jgi:hypothetical protein
VLVITWDEGDSNDKGGGHIATIMASPDMTPGSHFDGPATHYSMLRTIELAWGMPFLGAKPPRQRRSSSPTEHEAPMR